MNLNRRLEPLPELDLDLPEHHEILLLATVLIVGLTFVTPALSLILGVPALVFVAIIGAIYGTLALLLRRVLAGSLVGLLVTSTFMANIPLASTTYINSFPGHIGPELWLVQIPLVAALVLGLLTGPREVFAGATKADGLFAAFVGWTVLSALFGATVRLDRALYFSLLIFQALVVFVLFRYAVQRELLSFELVAQVFVGIVLAQSLFAVAQFLNGDIFGVGALGEFAHGSLATVSLGPLGTFTTGTYVAGFTGMSFLLASLIVLAVPMAATMALRNSGCTRAALLGAALVMTAVLRATGTDAGRGALVVAVGFLCAAFVYSKRTAIRNWIRKGFSMTSARVTNVAMVVLTMVVGIVALFYPSSASGRSSFTTDIGGAANTNAGGGTGGGASTATNAGGGTGGGASTATNAGGGTGGGAGTATNAQPTAIESLLHDLSIPFFDISTLGGRLQQYVAGIDLFLRYPLFGVGGANFLYYSTDYGLPPSVLHNTYIALLAQTGLPGFVFFVALLGLVLWYGWTAAQRTADGVLLIGAICGVVGWCAFAFWDHPYDKMTTMMPFVVLLGTVVGAYAQCDT